jgi:dienelactone hydrolase
MDHHNLTDPKQQSGCAERRQRILSGGTLFLTGASILFTAFLVSETLIGKSMWLRILLGALYTATAVTLVFAGTKLLKTLPARFTSAFVGATILIAWFVYDVLSAFIILPFSASLLLTVATSLLISVIVVGITALAGLLLTAYPKSAGAVFGMTALFLIAAWMTGPGFNKAPRPIVHDTSSTELVAPYPAAVGKFNVQKLYYGSGTDKQRPEYGPQTNLITKTVDASAFVPEGWSVARTEYWGFDQTHLPLNGRVWYPEGQGPFPLVLIVHGTRAMTEFSDAGFAYLGELLASRGYIVASIDENFLNYGTQRYGDFKESDVDARGWLLLRHLILWRDWNRTKENPFFKKVDTDRIALIGHSRGGEAIAAAEAFNRMRRYPKNGCIQFSFNFKIKTLIAFAPSDIQQPAYERTTPAEIRDVNYLLLLGTHDRQVPSILGSRVYQRVHFSNSSGTSAPPYYMKAALYIHRANHSQFNSDWGIYDFPWPYRLFTNIKAQLNADEQRQIVKVYVSSFLDATLKGDKRYIPLFRDYRTITDWLPKTTYISRFQNSTFRAFADFDEDIDPATATIPGGEIKGRDLSQWHEQDIDYHYFLPFGTRSNRLVLIGWRAGKERSPMWGIRLPANALHSRSLKPSDNLAFSLYCPDQKRVPDISIQLSDTKGHKSKLPLRSTIMLQRPLYYLLTKFSFLEKPTPVMILQTVSIPFSRFLRLNPLLDLTRLYEVDFFFNNENGGKVLFDDIGIDQ